MSFTKNAVDTTLVGQTGTGEFVGSNSPDLVTPSLGVATCDSLTVTGAGSLPTADGTMGQVLTTTGGGVWSFQNAATGTVSGAANVGGGTPTYLGTTSNVLQLGTIAAGANVNFVTSGGLTTISSSGSGTTFPYEQAFWVSQNNGADSALGTSIDTPFLTLGYAIAQAGIVPTIIYLVDGFTNTETITTSGFGQALYISAPGTIMNGTITIAANDTLEILAPYIAGITNSGTFVANTNRLVNITSTGASSISYLSTVILNGLALADSTVCYLACTANIGSITNDASAILNATTGGTLPGWAGDNEISGRLLANSIAFSPTTHGVVGTPTNDNAAAGYVGEYLTVNVPYASRITLTSNIRTNLASRTLTAGDWEVWGNVYFEFSSGYGYVCNAWITTTSAGNVDQSLWSVNYVNPGNQANITCEIVPVRFSVPASTTITVYVVAYSIFSTGASAMCGNIYARRFR